MVTSDNKTADTDEKIFIGKGEETAWLALALANRHGLVTGATGTGKTVSLQVMAEGFARAGVPVFAADIKGDLSGISEVGEGKDFILKRAKDMGLNFQPDQFSTVFWDVFGEQGHPVRATVTEMGPLLLARMLDLNDVQEGVLNVAFRVADENGEPYPGVMITVWQMRYQQGRRVPFPSGTDRTDDQGAYRIPGLQPG